jgi:lipopolysaccharide export system protein LptA
LKVLATAAGAMALVLSARPAAQGAERPPVRIDAEEVQYLYKDHKVVFVGKPLVKLTREDAVLTCKKLVAENDTGGQLRRAVCTGDVKLVRGGREVTCETATFDDQASTVVCRGNPVLRDGQSVLEGDELTYDLGEDKAVLSRAKGVVVPRPGQEPGARRKGAAP